PAVEDSPAEATSAEARAASRAASATSSPPGGATTPSRAAPRAASVRVVTVREAAHLPTTRGHHRIRSAEAAAGAARTPMNPRSDPRLKTFRSPQLLMAEPEIR